MNDFAAPSVARDPATAPAGGDVRVRRLGRAPYEPVWRAMQAFTDARTADTPDEFWLVEHDPVFTLGQAARPEHLLAPGDIPVVQVDRGGQVTYHGPGQQVIYTLVDLRRAGIGIKRLVDILEQAIIEELESHGLDACRRAGAPGVYVGDCKIAALGLRVRRGSSFHGLALNVDGDLEPFERIDPCGYRGLRVTSTRREGVAAARERLAEHLVQRLARRLGYQRIVAAAAALESG